MPYLQMAYTDRFGTLHPAALIEIRDVRVELAADHAEVALDIWDSIEAKNAGADPIEERPPSALTANEISVLRNQFGLATYQIIQARAEFQCAEMVP